MPPLPRPRPVLGRLTTLVCLLPLLQACGGRSDTRDYLYDESGSGATTSGASSNSGAQGSGANGNGANGTGANGNGANGTGANGNGANGTGANGTGATSAGGTGPIIEGGAPAGGTEAGGTGQGTAGAPAGPRITCGDTTCAANKEICCAGFGGVGCLAKGSDCNGAVLECSNGDDCPGRNVCCLRVVGDVGEGSECKPSCDGMGPARERQLCTTNDECPFDHCRPTVFGVNVCTRR